MDLVDFFSSNLFGLFTITVNVLALAIIILDLRGEWKIWKK